MVINDIKAQVLSNFEELKKVSTSDFVEDFSKRLLLFLIDSCWREHMVALDELKQGVGLRAFSQMDPLQAFKTESFDMFDEMMNYIREDVLKTFMGVYTNMCLNLGLKAENMTHNSES
jgi:preprotein translocase subunit SecA